MESGCRRGRKFFWHKEALLLAIVKRRYEILISYGWQLFDKVW